MVLIIVHRPCVMECGKNGESMATSMMICVWGIRNSVWGIRNSVWGIRNIVRGIHGNIGESSAMRMGFPGKFAESAVYLGNSRHSGESTVHLLGIPLIAGLKT